MDSELKNYEVAYLINPDVAEDGVFGEAGKITGFVQDAHGLVGRIEEPKRRRLSYPIGKFKQAYFGWTTFTLAPERLAEFVRKVKAEKNVIRHTVTEEIKWPVVVPRPRAVRPSQLPRLDEVKAAIPQPIKKEEEEDKIKIEELDKRLEEILGK